MNDSLSQSRSVRIKETGTDTRFYLAGAIQSQLTRRAATKERAQRLYAIGELNAAAQMLCELAARRQLYRAEALNG